MGSSLLGRVKGWISETPLRSLDAAYHAAQAIKTLEEKHFEGQPIGTGSQLGQNTLRYFEIELQKHLRTIQVRLAEFRASCLLSPTAQLAVTQEGELPTSTDGSRNGFGNGNGSRERASLALSQLQFIDEIQSHYQRRAASPIKPPLESVSMVPASSTRLQTEVERYEGDRDEAEDETDILPMETVPRTKPKMKKTGLFPRSLLETANRITKELRGDYEVIALEEAKNSRIKTIAAAKFLVILIILPLLAQILSKNLLYSPLLDQFQATETPQITFNLELQERALKEMQLFRERLEFEELLGISGERSPQETKKLLHEKATELTTIYTETSKEGIKNILADLTYLGAFAWIIYLGRGEISLLKGFLDQLVYGLSDSAKAFIIIMFTDIFVGYHSSHGWEVLLVTISEHLGIPESPMFNGAFIATFPVVLDTLFKYWIFRYLNQISPSAVATYKNMNE